MPSFGDQVSVPVKVCCSAEFGGSGWWREWRWVEFKVMYWPFSDT
jgi:hypothetical protein